MITSAVLPRPTATGFCPSSQRWTVAPFSSNKHRFAVIGSFPNISPDPLGHGHKRLRAAQVRNIAAATLRRLAGAVYSSAKRQHPFDLDPAPRGILDSVK